MLQSDLVQAVKFIRRKNSFQLNCQRTTQLAEVKSSEESEKD